MQGYHDLDISWIDMMCVNFRSLYCKRYSASDLPRQIHMKLGHEGFWIPIVQLCFWEKFSPPSHYNKYCDNYKSLHGYQLLISIMTLTSKFDLQ